MEMPQRMIDRVRAVLPGRLGRRGPLVPVVRLAGAISGGIGPGSRGLNLVGVAGALARAFAVRDAPAVAVLVNSPGGSPVQSHLIHRRIRALAEEKRKPVLVFVEDVAASGGYMLACAGDEIFADPSSIVGSIGVVSQGFGFVGLIERIGVERRLYTSGASKAILDPFRPEREEDVAHLKGLQREVHDHFIALVRERRGARLAVAPDLFSGLFWSGTRALSLGLVDGLGDARTVLRERYGDKVQLRLIQPSRPSLIQRALFGSTGGLADGALSALEERALWSRYGL